MRGFTSWAFGFVLAGCGNIASTGDARTDDARTCVPSPAGLQARWRGEMNAQDDTGAHDGMLAFAQYAPMGRHGAAFLFDGGRSVLTADPEDSLWPPGSFSIEAWVKSAGVTSSAIVVEKYGCGGADGCDNSEYLFEIHPGGNPQFQYRTGRPDMPVPLVQTLPGVNVTDGAWHHLVGVRDVHAAEQRFYLDGMLAVTTPLGPNDLAPLSNVDGKSDPLTIGAGRSSGQDTPGFFFPGAIDEVAIYYSALQNAEVAAIYAAPDGVCP